MKIQYGQVCVAYECIHPATGEWVEASPNWRTIDRWKECIVEIEGMQKRADRRNLRLMLRGMTVPVEIHSQAEALDIIATEYIRSAYDHNDLFDAFEAGYGEGWQYHGDRQGYIRGAFEDWLRNKEAEGE